MKRLEYCLFVDIVAGEVVNLYQDRLGRKWLATNAWSSFRVATKS